MCIDGVKDLFMIRNKMIAHPAGRTAAGSTTAPETGERLEVRAPSAPAEYNKLRGFPIQVSQFTAHHAVALIAEVRDFLLEYRGAIEKYISDAETLAACDAKELNAFLDSN